MLAGAANVADLRRAARKRLPGGVFDYVDGAADEEMTLRRNETAFGEITFTPRVLAGVESPRVSTSILGKESTIPVVLAPTGFTRIVHPEGEKAVARGAEAFGVPYTLSTLATTSIEGVAHASPGGDNWFQLYVWKDRGLVKELIARAKDSGFRVLMPTVDTPVLGRRLRDHRRGFTLPPKLGVGTLWDGVRHPGWTWAFVRSEPITFANLTGASVGDGSSTAVFLSEYVQEQFDRSLSWNDIEWLRDEWSGPLAIKGILSPDDAAKCADIGCDAVVVSNHGGRQLDGSVAALDALPSIADRVGSETEVICDGGVRQGADIAKAMSRGASAVMLGRPYLYALAVAGTRGVHWLLERLEDDLARTLILLGLDSVDDLAA